MSCHWWNCLDAIKGDIGQVTSPGGTPPNLPNFGGPHPGTLGSTQPTMPPISIPNGGNVPTGIDGADGSSGGSNGGSGGCLGLPSWVCSAGGAIAGAIIPKNSSGGVDWGKLAGYGAAGAGAYTAYETGKANQDYLNKLLAMTTDRNNRAQADYASRAPIRNAVNSEVQGKIANSGNDIFTPYLHKGQGQ